MPSVSIADASGYDIPQFVIEPDMGKLQELGFSLQEFENCLKSSDISLGNLTIRDREYQYDINFKSLVGGKEDIENIYFKKDSRIIQLKDVAKVYSSEAERVGCIYDGRQRIISIAVIKQGNCRMSEVRKETEDLISSMSEDYPEIDPAEHTVCSSGHHICHYSFLPRYKTLHAVCTDSSCVHPVVLALFLDIWNKRKYTLSFRASSGSGAYG